MKGLFGHYMRCEDGKIVEFIAFDDSQKDGSCDVGDINLNARKPGPIHWKTALEMKGVTKP